MRVRSVSAVLGTRRRGLRCGEDVLLRSWRRLAGFHASGRGASARTHERYSSCGGGRWNGQQKRDTGATADLSTLVPCSKILKQEPCTSLCTVCFHLMYSVLYSKSVLDSHCVQRLHSSTFKTSHIRAVSPFLFEVVLSSSILCENVDDDAASIDEEPLILASRAFDAWHNTLHNLQEMHKSTIGWLLKRSICLTTEQEVVFTSLQRCLSSCRTAPAAELACPGV